MDLQESAMDNMNRLATYIQECPKCGGEDIEYQGHQYDSESLCGTDFMKCATCKTEFKSYT